MNRADQSLGGVPELRGTVRGRDREAQPRADGGYDRDNVSAAVAERHPDAAIIVPPRTSAVLSDTAEAAVGRWKQVIGDGLRAHTDECRATEVEVAAYTLNRMLELGRPKYVRTA